VILGSPLTETTLPFTEGFIDLNLMIRKGFAFFPIRVWVKKTGPLPVSQTKAAKTDAGSKSKASSTPDTNRSNTLLPQIL
jgi:hypothetical protein